MSEIWGAIRKDKKSYSNFRKNPQCKYCSREQYSENKAYDYNYVYNYFQQYGCELLDTKYKSCKDKLKYRAKCGHIDYVTFDSFKSNKHHICRECIKNINKGEKSYNWKGGNYSSDSIAFRKTYEFKKWQKDVYKRDNYTCQCCGDNKGGNLNAHHLDGYNWCVEKRTDIDNGITLCEDCHEEFHRLYGYGDNTKEQFNEFITIKDVKLA